MDSSFENWEEPSVFWGFGDKKITERKKAACYKISHLKHQNIIVSNKTAVTGSYNSGPEGSHIDKEVSKVVKMSVMFRNKFRSGVPDVAEAT